MSIDTDRISASGCESDAAVPEEFSREAMLIGEDAVKLLMGSTAAVFGLGGVGGMAAEALCRSGVGNMMLIDGDVFSRSNINRQIFAVQESIGRKKTQAAAERLYSINPDIMLEPYDIFYNEQTANIVPIERCDIVIDAIDTVASKLLLIENCVRNGIEIISCMGAGNKLDPSRFEAADISETSMCPLARVMRKELRKRGIEHLRVIYSREPAAEIVSEAPVREHSRRPVPGSAAFCAPAAGLAAAAEAVRLLTGKRR